MLVLLATLVVGLVLSDDPAQGWLGYAKGVNPAGTGIITFIEAYWIGDNKNLIQPVNPWSATHWEIYNEYFQWSPTHNENSRSHDVSAGDLVYGSVTYNKAGDSYDMYHCDINIGWCVNMTVGIQKGNNGEPKTYDIIYFVMEKEAACGQYPPNDQVTFTNISVYYDNELVQPTWTTSYVDNVCDCRAHIVDEQTIQITWNSKSDEFDDLKQHFGDNEKYPPL